MAKDPSAKLQNPEFYNHRDVLSLKPLSQWTYQEEQTHLNHNRILQPGFANRKGSELINNAKLAGEQWLTDVCCPSVKTALVLNISKEMVVNYQVAEQDLGTACHKVYDLFLQKFPDIIKEQEKAIENRLQEETRTGGKLDESVIEKKALERLERNKVNLTELGAEQEKAAIEAAKEIERDMVRKNITNQVINSFVKEQMQEISEELALKPKELHQIGENNDFSFLGAAGSGKSTISRQWLTDQDKSNYVVLATDNYRAFTIPGTEMHEQTPTKDVFTRTQDMAYMVKELVQEEVAIQVKQGNSRPNVICDCVTLEPSMKELLTQGTAKSVVAVYSGEPGYVGIAERADSRARDDGAAPADKGRFVNTTSLLEGHANASSRFLASLPASTVTELYNTNVERGTAPVKIGQVDTDTSKNIIEITDLRLMAAFLNKRNINAEAVNQVDLIYNSRNPLNTLSTHPENQAKSIIDLVPETRFKQAFTVSLKDKNGIEYARLEPGHDKPKLQIIDERIFMDKAMSDTIDGSLLRSITRQIEKGSLDKSLDAVFAKGDKQSFIDSAKSLGVSSQLALTPQQKSKKTSVVSEFAQELQEKAQAIAQKISKKKLMNSAVPAPKKASYKAETQMQR